MTMESPGVSWGEPVPVVVDASCGIWAGPGVRYAGARYPMWVEFRPGGAFRLRPGPNEFQLPPGRYRADFRSAYLFFDVGKAALSFEAVPGHPVTVFYATPYTLYTRGTAGFTAQRRPGRWGLLGIPGAVAVIFLVCWLIAAIVR